MEKEIFKQVEASFFYSFAMCTLKINNDAFYSSFALRT